MANDLAQFQRRAWLRAVARRLTVSRSRRLLEALGRHLVPVQRRRRALLRATLVLL